MLRNTFFSVNHCCAHANPTHTPPPPNPPSHVISSDSYLVWLSDFSPYVASWFPKNWELEMLPVWSVMGNSPQAHGLVLKIMTTLFSIFNQLQHLFCFKNCPEKGTHQPCHPHFAYLELQLPWKTHHGKGKGKGGSEGPRCESNSVVRAAGLLTWTQATPAEATPHLYSGPSHFCMLSSYSCPLAASPRVKKLFRLKLLLSAQLSKAPTCSGTKRLQ